MARPETGGASGGQTPASYAGRTVTHALVAASLTGVVVASALLWLGHAALAMAVYILTVFALAATISWVTSRGRRA